MENNSHLLPNILQSMGVIHQTICQVKQHEGSHLTVADDLRGGLNCWSDPLWRFDRKN